MMKYNNWIFLTIFRKLESAMHDVLFLDCSFKLVGSESLSSKWEQLSYFKTYLNDHKNSQYEVQEVQ